MPDEQRQLSQEQKVDRMFEAMYGDGNGNPGVHEMVKEMYAFYSGTKLGGKTLRNIVTFIASLCIALYVIVQVIRGRNPF